MSAHRPTIMATEHAISAGHYLATQAGMAVLDAGGNAIDAGVAAGIALGVVQSDLVNFAGVAPILLWHADSGRIQSIDGLGTWPGAVTLEYFGGAQAVPEGIERTIVPAAPSAWLTALEQFGTMSFGDVAAAAIRLAGDGFAIDPVMCAGIEGHAAGFGRWPANRAIYLPNGRPPRPGERFVQADLAATLRHMADEERAHAREGRSAGIRAAHAAFYEGDIAAAIVDFHRDNGGLLRHEDLSGFRARFEPTVTGRFRDYEVHCCGPWSQGPALAQLLGLLDRLDLPALGHNSPAYAHAVVEAIKLAFADRERFFTDPAFGDVPLDGLLDPSYLDARCSLVDPGQAWPDVPPPGDPYRGAATGPDAPFADAAAAARGTDPHDARPLRIAPDTSYVCAVDRDGNVFSATPSDTASDGPVIPGLGICPSTRGCQSRLEADHPLLVAPGKRPRLTPNPAIAFRDGRPVMPFGTPGGDVQVQAMAQVFVNVAAFGMDVQEAIESPRFATFGFPSSFSPHERFPGRVMVEARLPGETLAELCDRGHDAQAWPDWTRQAGAVCAIHVDEETGVLHAGADPRRSAYALGR